MSKSTLNFNFGFSYLHTEYDAVIKNDADVIVEQIGTIVKHFSTRIFDVRWAARRHARTIARAGLPAEYYRAFYLDINKRNELIGTKYLSGIGGEQIYRSMRAEAETNVEVGYFPPMLIKVLQPNFTSSLTQEERGTIYEAEAQLTVPAYFMFHRWDMIKIQGQNWIVIEEPKIIYSNRGYLEAFSLRVKSLRSGIIDF
jgi:predicted RNA methylase